MNAAIPSSSFSRTKELSTQAMVTFRWVRAVHPSRMRYSDLSKRKKENPVVTKTLITDDGYAVVNQIQYADGTGYSYRVIVPAVQSGAQCEVLNDKGEIVNRHEIVDFRTFSFDNVSRDIK